MHQEVDKGFDVIDWFLLQFLFSLSLSQWSQIQSLHNQSFPMH